MPRKVRETAAAQQSWNNPETETQIGEKPRTFRSTCTRSIVYFRPQLAAKKRTRK
jgi:hypothetical protein